MATGRPKQLKLNLDSILESRLDELLPKVAESAAAQEFGIKVDRVLVARIALLRGLDAMERGSAAPPVVGRPKGRVKEEPKPEKKPEPLPSAEDTAEHDEHGMIVPPPGWRKWADSELFPDCQQSTHDYYISNGWDRYYGSSPAKQGDEVISFYWCRDSELQSLSAFDEALKVQATPWGPGHIIPHGWKGPVSEAV
jgi:hypothetical protein